MKIEKFDVGQTINSDDLTYEQQVLLLGKPLADELKKKVIGEKQVEMVCTRVDRKRKSITFEVKK